METKSRKPFQLIGLAVLILVIGFVAKNLYDESKVEKVEQDSTLTDRAVELAQEEEQVEEISDNEQIGETGEEVFKERSGAFGPGMATYSGSGLATIKTIDGQPVLVFDENFTVSSGPDLQVYLSKSKVASGEELGEFISLGSLQSNSGAQAYNLPDDYEDFNSVVIWCRAFTAEFSSADLN